VRQDRGEDVSDTNEVEEGEIGDDDGGITWDALVEEDGPAGSDPSQQQVGVAMGTRSLPPSCGRGHASQADEDGSFR
jgi:hypothetical protein